jgi:hypothetical protein
MRESRRRWGYPKYKRASLRNAMGGGLVVERLVVPACLPAFLCLALAAAAAAAAGGLASILPPLCLLVGMPLGWDRDGQKESHGISAGRLERLCRRRQTGDGG